MAFDLQEQEQIAELKAFWHDYGRNLAIVLAIALLAFAGWKGWQAWSNRQHANASELYMTVEANTAELSKSTAALETLKKDFPRTPYAARAALLVANAAFSSKDLGKANTELKWVVDNAQEAALRDLARVRLANVWIDQKKYDEALALLKPAEDQSLASLYSETRGDILLLKGDKAAAAESYKQTLAKLAKDAPNYKLVEIKLESTGIH